MIENYLDRSDETALMEDLDRIRKSATRKVFYACYIGFDRAAWFGRHREYFDVVTHSVSKFVWQNQGKMYKLHNFDLCFTLRIENPRMVERMIFRLFALLQQHATALSMTEQQIEEVTVWYQLEDDLAALTERVQTVAAIGDDAAERRRRLLQKAGAAPADVATAALTAQALADIEKALARADIDSLIRNQPICAVNSGLLPVPVFREIYVSMTHLKGQVAPNIDMRGSRALFHHLTRMLDQRVLRAIMGGYIGTGFGPFSLNLTIQTILSPLFREFDEQVGQIAKKNQIIIEIQRYDVFWDYGAFKMACAFLHANGYRILIDGVTPNVMHLFSLMDLSVDFVKLFAFKDEFADWTNPNMIRRINDNSGLVILGRCSGDGEMRIGMDAGIRLFQGWHIDDALRNKQPVTLAAV